MRAHGIVVAQHRARPNGRVNCRAYMTVLALLSLIGVIVTALRSPFLA